MNEYQCSTSPKAFPRMVVAGTHSGAGKTTLSLGLLAAFHRRGLGPVPFKVGPDYIDPAFHTRVTGVPSRNLDTWLLGETAARRVFLRHAARDLPGLSVIEGVMGLFDGQGEGPTGSTADVARLLQAPVILTVNGRGMARSAAAMVGGYAAFDPEVNLAGVILTRVKTDRHFGLLKGSIEGNCGIRCLGYVPENEDYSLPSRHLGLVPAGEMPCLDVKIAALAGAVEDRVDLDALLAICRSGPFLRPETARSGPSPIRARLGVARDPAFTFYYQDNLDLLQAAGADLVFFSPLDDAALPPELDGLYLGGGFPEMFAERLEANHSMRDAVRGAADAGMPLFAECGGMVYLCRSVVDQAGRERAMAGVFPQKAVMTGGLRRFGYAEAEFAADLLLGPAGTRVRVHEFHYSRLEPDGLEPCLVLRKEGREPWRDGLAKGNILAMYPHVHFEANPALAESFVERCAGYRKKRLGG